MATNRRWRDKDGNNKDEVCFVELTAYGRQAEVINQYMSKGRPMLIEGHLRFSQWTNKEGQKRSKLDAVVENFTFLGGGQGGGGARAGAPAQAAAPAAAPAPSDDEAPPPVDDLPVDDPDVPF